MATKNEEQKTNNESKKFAVIRTGGKQYLVCEGQQIEVELLDGNENDAVEFECLLSVNGDKVEVGTPVLNSKVQATIIEETKGDKLTVFKYKNRKNYRVRTGHRQHYTKVKIGKIA